MPPPPPPELVEDAIAEILLRVPPDEPAHLMRASLVCKLWLRIASDPAFVRRYRAFHRGAPLLGFFCNLRIDPDPLFPPRFAPRFVSTTEASPFPQAAGDRSHRWVHDCRHGRVLLENTSRNFVVWDPITGDREELPASYMTTISYTAVVLCAVAGCDHSRCRGGPFHVFYVCIDETDTNYAAASAFLYSSETRAWATPVSANLQVTCFDTNGAALIGDGIYCLVEMGLVIVRYDLVKKCFSFIHTPDVIYRKRPVLMQNEDGSLGYAGVMDSRLHLWSRMMNKEETGGWVQWKVIELEKILPIDKPLKKAKVIGFAEGMELLSISTDVGAFTIELKSGRVRKISGPGKYYSATPFISFFTPDSARIKHPLVAVMN